MNVKIFNEDSVKVFLNIIPKMITDLSNNLPKTTYPTNQFFHVMKGEGGQEFHFVIALLLTTDNSLTESFAQELKIYAQQMTGKKPIENYTPKTYQEDKSELSNKDEVSE